jgi:hypothetical protein
MDPALIKRQNSPAKRKSTNSNAKPKPTANVRRQKSIKRKAFERSSYPQFVNFAMEKTFLDRMPSAH